MTKSKTYVNEDTYQTLKDINIKPMPKVKPFEKAITPLWKDGSGEGKLLIINLKQTIQYLLQHQCMINVQFTMLKVY